MLFTKSQKALNLMVSNFLYISSYNFAPGGMIVEMLDYIHDHTTRYKY